MVNAAIVGGPVDAVRRVRVVFLKLMVGIDSVYSES